MPRVFARLITLLLISGLILDPNLAAGGYPPAAVPLSASAFQQQALISMDVSATRWGFPRSVSPRIQRAAAAALLAFTLAEARTHAQIDFSSILDGDDYSLQLQRRAERERAVREAQERYQEQLRWDEFVASKNFVINQRQAGHDAAADERIEHLLNIALATQPGYQEFSVNDRRYAEGALTLVSLEGSPKDRTKALAALMRLAWTDSAWSNRIGDRPENLAALIGFMEGKPDPAWRAAAVLASASLPATAIDTALVKRLLVIDLRRQKDLAKAEADDADEAQHAAKGVGEVFRWTVLNRKEGTRAALDILYDSTTPPAERRLLQAELEAAGNDTAMLDDSRARVTFAPGLKRLADERARRAQLYQTELANARREFWVSGFKVFGVIWGPSLLYLLYEWAKGMSRRWRGVGLFFIALSVGMTLIHLLNGQSGVEAAPYWAGLILAGTTSGEGRRKADLQKSIDMLELNSRGRNALKNLGAKTIGDAVRLTERQIRKLKNTGPETIIAINAALARYGYALGQGLSITEDILSERLEILNLSVHTEVVLLNFGVKTVGDVVRLTERQVLKRKYTSPNTIIEINAALAPHGYALDQAALITKDLLSERIEVLELDMRSENALSNYGVKKVRELVRLQQKQLLRIKGIHRRSLERIKLTLARHGLAAAREFHFYSELTPAQQHEDRLIRLANQFWKPLDPAPWNKGSDASDALILYDGDRPVGIYAFRIDSLALVIGNGIYVSPLRQKLGTLLREELFRQLKERGYRKFMIMGTQHTSESVGFNEALDGRPGVEIVRDEDGDIDQTLITLADFTPLDPATLMKYNDASRLAGIHDLSHFFLIGWKPLLVGLTAAFVGGLLPGLSLTAFAALYFLPARLASPSRSATAVLRSA